MVESFPAIHPAGRRIVVLVSASASATVVFKEDHPTADSERSLFGTYKRPGFFIPKPSKNDPKTMERFPQNL